MCSGCCRGVLWRGGGFGSGCGGVAGRCAVYVAGDEKGRRTSGWRKAAVVAGWKLGGSRRGGS